MEFLSLWRSPLDKVALTEAAALCHAQPRCSISYGEDFSAMTIYNFGHYISLGLSPDAALTQMFSDMDGTSQPYGGRAFIPQQSFPVHASSAGFSVPDQCDIDGSGGGGIPGSFGGSSFFHFVITPLTTSSSKFFSCTGGVATNGGVYFRSLAFQWALSSYAADTCIDAGFSNTRAVNCTFTDCPCAFSAQANSCTLEQCTIDYTVPATQGPNNMKAVILGSTQCAVVGPGQFSQTSRSGGGATGCTCISIESADHPIISNMEILEWAIGVDFSQDENTRWAQISNCAINCWQTALNIQLRSAATHTTAGVKISGCTLTKTSDSTDTNPIAVIDTNGVSDQTQLNDIALIDCTVYNMAAAPALSAQHGLLIAGGSNIKIIGGTYSNNGPHAGAGIAITGGEDIQIIGANLQPSYPGAPNHNNQKYALLVTASPSTGALIVSGCDMTGYSGGGSPVSVTMPQTRLRIYDCPGYNDQNTPLTPVAGTLTTGTSAATSSVPYFGPSVIAYSGTAIVTLTVFGRSITSNSGIVFLPSPYDSFSFNAAPIFFSWFGK